MLGGRWGATWTLRDICSRTFEINHEVAHRTRDHGQRITVVIIQLNSLTQGRHGQLHSGYRIMKSTQTVWLHPFSLCIQFGPDVVAILVSLTHFRPKSTPFLLVAASTPLVLDCVSAAQRELHTTNSTTNNALWPTMV